MTYFQKKYLAYFVSGNIYYGYMDMTYFSIITESLKKRKLKIAIVFLYETFRFETWLAGTNKQFQSKYWKLFKERGWNKYPIVPTINGVDSFLEHVVVDDPDFSDLDSLTKKTEKATLNFTRAVESFLENT